ncbi:LysM peptidoglycan-binding domain-containing protein [Paenibacillus filicis]|uniref:LysM peptidoglycan-binding domain-containing protein n=1 Tax=Paenibacillus gyeongsangnamensis TaxID=3388067 RepID=A0ABT4Q8K2_9BACL|nr:LysM peptidoglycan-binding domain-containing protein [Paenibacillus filicis]MCZ8513112.1 LysM peptidoglycan-binding domain-containing protein [Paenibacillus filicis]
MYQNDNLLNSYNNANNLTNIRIQRRTERSALHNNKRTYVRLSSAALFASLFIILFGLFAGGFGDKGAFAATEHVQAQPFVIVGHGETLWSIASEHAGKGKDVRDYIDEIRKANGLKQSKLQEGQKLLLP